MWKFSCAALAFWVCVCLFVDTARDASAGDIEPSSAGQGRFLILSDFHFDPFDGLSPSQFERLAAAPLDEWPELLSTQPAPTYGRDAPADLILGCLADARRRIPEPDFILFPGDFLAHGWQKKYDRLAPRRRSDDETAYRRFTANVMRFLFARIAQTFPQAAFLPVLGNDDSYCGDYMIAPASPFTAMFAEAVASQIERTQSHADIQALRASCSRGGYYTMRLPRLTQHRLIALNTIFFALQYNNACGSSSATPALDQLNWLDSVLAAASAAGETVWLLMHIPPGIDSYQTNKAQGLPQPFWQPELTARFLQLVQKYRATIQGSFAGHTHMDDYRVIRLDDAPVLLTKITPAISPIFGNNPGYQVFQYDRKTGGVSNYQTFFLPLAKNPTAPTVGATTEAWRLAYDFHETFDTRQFDAAEIVRLARGVADGGPQQQPYLRHYTVDGPPSGISPRILSSAIPCTTVAEFNAMYRAMSAAKE